MQPKYATALYGRTSKDDRRKVTIEIQQTRLGKWAQADEQVSALVDEYWDDGVSGKIPLAERPEGGRLLQDIHTGKIEALAVLYADRFGRTALDGLQAAKLLEDRGVKLVAVEDGWDARRADSPLYFQIRMALAEEEHRRISQRMADGKRRAMERDNAPPGGPLTFGYRMDDRGHYVIDPVEGPVVLRIFEMCLSGLSNFEILAWIRTQGIPAGRKFQKRVAGSEPVVCADQTEARWHLTKIAKILANPVYTGVRRWAGKTFPCPALVTQQTFDEAQARRAGPKNAFRRATPETCLCSGLFTCAGCGESFYHLPKRGNKARGETYVYSVYSCQGYRTQNCRAKQLRCDEVDAAVWRCVEEYLADPEEVVRKSLAADAVLGRQVADYDAEEQRLEQRMKEIEADVADLWEQQRKNNWPMSWVTPRMNQLAAAREIALEGRKQLRAARAASLVDRHEATRAIAFLAEIRAGLGRGLTAEQKHHIIRLLVAGGTVTTIRKDGRITADLIIQLRWGESRSASGEVPKDWYNGTSPDATIPCRIPYGSAI